jgi:anti-sigma factor ChrR (cupin superfamily)
MKDRTDPHLDAVGAYALGALDPEERAAFEAHAAQCGACKAEVGAQQRVVSALPHVLDNVVPDAKLRQQLFDLSLAPTLPIDLGAYAWQEVVPGIRIHVLREEPERGVRACLVWATPGARHPRHRHLGDENILVLQGSLLDDRGSYGPGQVCHSRTDSIHAEQIGPGEDCICYVVYYGELQPLET